MNDDLQVGLANLHYALFTTADDALVAPVYAAPLPVTPMVNAKITSKSSSTTFYGDDAALAVATAQGDTEVEFELRNIPLSIRAAWLGHAISGGVMIENKSDVAPYIAIGFESVKANGGKRFVWLYKGKFLIPDDDFKTKEDKVSFQTPKIKGVFIHRSFDGNKRKFADTEEVDYVASVGTNWYAAVEGAADVVAPTVTVLPLDVAVGVLVTAPFVWTFSEAILASTVIPANFHLINDSTGATIAGTLAINPARTVVTFQPAANLAAATAYRAEATIGVKDLAGNALATNKFTKFTTA